MIDLNEGEAIIATTAAQLIDSGRSGTLLLTTTRLLLVDGDEIAFEEHRSEIERASQLVTDLWVYRRKDLGPREKHWFKSYRPNDRGIGFKLRSAFAGPVRWDWHLAPPGQNDSTNWWGAAADPRVGPIDDARREVLAAWEAQTRMYPYDPIEHYLDDLPRAPVVWAEIVEIVYIVDGKGDRASWMLVVRLADRRWVYLSQVIEVTGDVFTTIIVARSLETLWWGAFTEDDRDRVTRQMTDERLDEELVRLDGILESSEGHVLEHAECRMAQIRLARNTT